MQEKSASAAYLIPSASYSTPDAANTFTDDTEQFAELNGVKAQSVRKRYSQTGSYFGVCPIRLANRRLKWPHVFATKHDGAMAVNNSFVNNSFVNTSNHGVAK